MSKKTSPSMDSWLKEAKAHESAPKIGMYLTHNGIVRESAKAKVRQGAADTRPVVGMQFSYNQEAVDAIIAETYKLVMTSCMCSSAAISAPMWWMLCNIWWVASKTSVSRK